MNIAQKQFIINQFCIWKFTDSLKYHLEISKRTIAFLEHMWTLENMLVSNHKQSAVWRLAWAVQDYCHLLYVAIQIKNSVPH